MNDRRRKPQWTSGLWVSPFCKKTSGKRSVLDLNSQQIYSANSRNTIWYLTHIDMLRMGVPRCTKNKGVTIRTVWSLERTRPVLLLFDFCFRPAPYCVSYIASLLVAVLPFPLLWFGRLDNIYQKWPCLVKVCGLFGYSIKPEQVAKRWKRTPAWPPQTACTSVEHGRYSHA